MPPLEQEMVLSDEWEMVLPDELPDPSDIYTEEELRELRAGPSWRRTPISQWPPHTRLSDSQYKSLFPPCWQDPKHCIVWVGCGQCRLHFQKLGLPSEWVCRCGLNNMYWRHHEPPPVTEMCKACGSLMAAEGIDWNEWSKQVVGGICGARGLSHE